MSGQKSRDDVDSMGAIKLGNHFEHLQLGVGIKAVAGLYLDRRSSAGEHFVQPSAALFDKFAYARVPGLANRRNNSAAVFENFKVLCPFYLQFELIKAVSRKNDVRMRVDKSGAND